VAAVNGEDVGEILGWNGPFQIDGPQSLKRVHADMHFAPSGWLRHSHREKVANIPRARSHAALQAHDVPHLGFLGAVEQVFRVDDRGSQRPFAIDVLPEAMISRTKAA